MKPIKYVCFGRSVISIAMRAGWKPGARYTNLRDCRHVGGPEFLDIDFRSYDFRTHLEVTSIVRPKLTIARDVFEMASLHSTIDQGYQLLEFSEKVAIVPKDVQLASSLEASIPKDFIFGYSVPTRYGGTDIPMSCFRREVHLLGGRPDTQYQLSKSLNVVSLDCNRFAFDARFGDYFDGETFRPHAEGGYENCIEASISNINKLWAS